MKANRSKAKANEADHESAPAWRHRAVSKSLSAARTRAEQRVQGLLDAAFELIDERGTTQFTIQEVVDRSKQSLRSFYEYFDGKDELLLAMFEETVREGFDDITAAVEAETDPVARLRAFIIRLHEWCEPADSNRKRGSHNRRPISEFTMQLAVTHAEQVTAAMAPITLMLLDLLERAVAAKVIRSDDIRRTASLVQQTVMYSWFGNRLVRDPRMRVTAEETWEFCLHGLTP